MGTAAKVVAGIGAAILLLAGACFLWVGESLLGGGRNTLWIVGVVLIVAGVLAVVAILGVARGRAK